MRPGALSPALLVLLSGCALHDVQAVRSPYGPVIDKYFPDVATCMGKWDSAARITDHQALVTWTHAATAAALQVTVPVFGSLTAGGGGGCTAAALVDRDGLVENFGFPGSYSTALVSAPYSNCEALISECTRYPNDTGKPAGYDLFDILGISPKPPAPPAVAKP